MAPAVITSWRARQLMLAHKPRGWTIREGGARQPGASGLCDWARKTLFVPTVCDDYSLAVYLHEVGHVRLHTRARPAAHVMEFEAERWAQAALRAAGFRVGREILRAAKANVAARIAEDRAAGVAIDAAVARWARRASRAKGQP